MSKSNIEIVSMGVKPDATAEVPDVKSAGGLSNLAAAASINSESAISPTLASLTPKQLTVLIKDPKVQAYAEATGKSVAAVAAEIKGTLPKTSGGLGEFMDSAGKGDLMGTFGQAVRLKASTPSSTYNSLSKDVFNKTMEFGGGITNQMNPLGDYFCKENSNNLTGNGFDLDKAMQAALKGAKLALAALGKCGFDTVAAIDDLDMDSGLKLAVGLTVAEDGSKNGVVDSVSNLHVRFKDKVPPSKSRAWAKNLSSSFTPGESTLVDEMDVFTDTMTELVPDFQKEGSPARTSLLAGMKDETLDQLMQDDNYVKDAAMVKLQRDSGINDLDSMFNAYGYSQLA